MLVFGSLPRGLMYRARAFLLLAVFLSAGTSLPSLDALAHHQDSGGSEKSRPHIEAAGGCLSHAGHCSLGRNAPGSNAGLAESRELRLDSTIVPSRLFRWIPAPPTAVRAGNPPSRAPPLR